jgi:hypothetical protein
MKDIDHLAPFVPFGQTVLRILLIVVGFVWAQTDLRAVFAAVAQRIKDGASLKAGPIELGGRAEEIHAKRLAHDRENFARSEKVENVLRDEIGATPEQISKVKDAMAQAERELSVSVEFPDKTVKEYSLAEVPVWNDLLDSVYLDGSRWIAPFTYGVKWFLEDMGTHVRFQHKHKREIHRVALGVPVRDTRSLLEVGIPPATKLRFVTLP